MYGGAVMEAGPVGVVLNDPRHPYTRALLAARPRLGAAKGARLQAIPGAASAVGGVARGCPFADRCPEVMTACREAEPQAARLPGGHVVRCLRVEPVEGEA